MSFRPASAEMVRAGRHGPGLQTDLQAIIELMAADLPLDRRFADHALSGEWDDHRDCHVHPDLILIYRKSEPNRLVLVRLGSHGELGL